MICVSKFKKSFFVLVSSIVLCGTVSAAEIKITQKGKVFRKGGDPVETIDVKVGDEVEFVNDDTAAHNVFSMTAGSKFNLKKQKPATSAKHKFDKKGEVTVMCAILPKMKLKVNVK